MKGKLVVIEGSDGAGKATQLTLLTEYCKKHTISYQTFDFPQYYKTFFGEWLGKFLKGDFGKLEEVPSQLVAFPYAADRWQAKDEIVSALKADKLVIVNRYVSSNAVYQSAKLPVLQRADFVKWVFKMEYEIFGLPQEDLVLFLHVPYAVSAKLIESKKNREYLGNKTLDIHEEATDLLQKVESVYLSFCKEYRHWEKIECAEGAQMQSKEAIHDNIRTVLMKKRIIASK